MKNSALNKYIPAVAVATLFCAFSCDKHYSSTSAKEVSGAVFLGYMKSSTPPSYVWKIDEVRDGWAYLDLYSSGESSLPASYQYSIKCLATDDIIMEINDYMKNGIAPTSRAAKFATPEPIPSRMPQTR